MPNFDKTYCSQCGGEFGPGDAGFSHCEDHGPDKPDLLGMIEDYGRYCREGLTESAARELDAIAKAINAAAGVKGDARG